MTRYDAVNYISHGIAKRPGMSETRSPRGAEEESTERQSNAEEGGSSKKKGEALETYELVLAESPDQVEALTGVFASSAPARPARRRRRRQACPKDASRRERE